MSEELKPCPFCGGGAQETSRFDVKCTGCGAEINAQPGQAAEFWNRRAAPDTMRAALVLAADKLKKEISPEDWDNDAEYSVRYVLEKLASEHPPAVCVPVEQIQKWHDFWAHYASVNEGCQDDMNEDRHATLADMLTAARKL